MKWDRSIVRPPVTTVAVTPAALAVAIAGFLYGRAALEIRSVPGAGTLLAGQVPAPDKEAAR
ncbi:MAG: hypothetical protein HYU54_02555 [Actinobacteria bacterium]|nr:hypothetical protein [Actinomycetota bacterium]